MGLAGGELEKAPIGQVLRTKIQMGEISAHSMDEILRNARPSPTRTLSHAGREGGKKLKNGLAETHNWLD